MGGDIVSGYRIFAYLSNTRWQSSYPSLSMMAKNTRMGTRAICCLLSDGGGTRTKKSALGPIAALTSRPANVCILGIAAMRLYLHSSQSLLMQEFDVKNIDGQSFHPEA